MVESVERRSGTISMSYAVDAFAVRADPIPSAVMAPIPIASLLENCILYPHALHPSGDPPQHV
jgi:hypothetical protein